MASRNVSYERLNLLWTACYCMVGLLGLRLLYMQVMRNAYYAQAAERNRTQIIHQSAPRGRIYDRNGVILADNRPAFSLIYLPRENQDSAQLMGLAASLAKELHREKDELFSRLEEASNEETAIHLAENLPLKTMFKLSELKTIYPGVDLIVEAQRFYPGGSMTGHVLGYMSKIDKRNWKTFKNQGYRVDAWVGKAGLEKLYERELRGRDGEIRMEVDAQGRLKRRLGQVIWKAGGNLYLTIDANIQRAAEEALKTCPSGKGAVVALDPRNGEVLALASVPEYDPNLFMLPDWDESKKALKDFPALNLALSGSFAPGSTFKIIVSAAMLQENKVSPASRVYCPGRFTLGNHTFNCWEKKGHHWMDWMSGLSQSCDVYFYTMGLRTGGPLIEEYQRRFHLGQPVGIELGGERAGNIFGPKARKSRGLGWYDGDTVNLSIGQGEVLMTPIQSAMMVATVANRGTVWRPHIVKKVEYADGRPPRTPGPEEMGKVQLRPDVWDLLHKGLVGVVQGGTGGRLNIPGLVVGGKTGTAQNPHGNDHAWFVAYASRPGELPSIAVAVLAQHGGHGASAAGPVARKVVEAAFGIPDKDKPQPQTKGAG